MNHISQNRSDGFHRYWDTCENS